MADRKAKKLASLLKGQRSALKAKQIIPFITTLVFLSAENVVNKLLGPAGLHVCTRTKVMDELSQIDAYWTHKKLDRPTSKVVARALEEAGIKESLRSRRVGLYELNELLDEADNYQDWVATHSETGIHRRIRIYLTHGKPEEEAETLRKTAKLEFRLLEGIEHTGMRAGEIKTLTRRQVNLHKRTVHLSETKNGSARTVPLTRDAADIFRIALSNPLRPLDTDLIFWGEPGRDGVRRPYEFRPAWHRTLKETGIKGLRFHDLRHEAVSRLVEGGLGDQEVAAISGHKSMQMLKRYTHLRAEDLVERLDRLMG